MGRVDVAALAVSILFLVFIVYEMAGGSDYKWAQNWHTLSFYGYRILWVRILLTAGPVAAYLVWITDHLSRYVPK